MEINGAASTGKANDGGGYFADENRDKRLKSEEPEDRISDLPDSLIHHILSFLPSTQEAIKTGILSKRWQYQWTRVPFLIFDSTGMSHELFSRLIDRTLMLYDSSTIMKLVIKTTCSSLKVHIEPLLPVWIRFAEKKQVKELVLDFCQDDDIDSPLCKWLLPQFLFNNVSLLNLKTINCFIILRGEVNWQSLKALCIGSCFLADEAIENIISGCPLLESLEITKCYGFDNLGIASKSLKRLVLEELDHVDDSCALEISCPNLDELELFGDLYFGSFKLMNLPSSACTTLDFSTYIEGFGRSIDYEVYAEDLFEDILQGVRYVMELNIGAWFMRVLAILEVVSDWCSPLLNTKCLTVDVPLFHKSFPGIAVLLSNSPLLEKLVIRLEKVTIDTWLTYGFGEEQWSADGIVFNCLGSLKTVEIVGLDERCDQYEYVLDFVKYLLKNARVLEEIVIFQDRGCRPDFALELSKELLSIPRCSPHAIVNLPCLTVRTHCREGRDCHTNETAD